MKLRLSPRARRDVQEIGAYLLARNPGAADRVRAEIRGHLHILETHPRAGRPVGLGLRRLPVARLPYLIFYRVDEAAGIVAVVTIRHTARRPIS